MKRTICITAVLGLGLALAPWTTCAQLPADQPAATPETTTTVLQDQQPTKEQLAKLFELMRVRDQLADVTQMMTGSVELQMQALYQAMQKGHPEMAAMTDEQKQAISKIIGKFMVRVVNLLTADEIIADMSALYQKHLTRSDVDGMIAFYGSPAGQHMLDVLPVIMPKQYMQLVIQRMEVRSKPASDEMTKEMEDYIKSQAALVGKPPAK
jgi:hypothetical protein